MDSKGQKKWYFKTGSLIISFLCVGPLMLPLVWANPDFNKKKKIIISAVVIILSYFVGALFFNALKSLNKYYQFLQNEIY
ncbi:MAG: hypothetical protein PHC71_02675 [Candidatus Omnitrophica bacterium]|nr:hypothetical protein [Candidatus Omnitrophota bacterium]